YLYDETQDVARAYHAACTPDFSVFNGDLNCVYRGALDGSIPGNDVSVTGEDMRNALDNILSGQPVNEVQRQSIGCGIKWHP
ncbi:MAG: thioredoxin family protein, partial [Flavobacteriales bacterium]|nr:thioredoxin family protein [Flavobacteriales bacterium]